MKERTWEAPVVPREGAGAVEKAAREKLGLVEPGEKVVVDPAEPVKK